MMDGQVAAVRAVLDAAGRKDVAILAYAAKYASAFYGPFREAVESTLQGDRRTYQLDPANRREGAREVDLDLAESADIVMVKPAMPYLDVLTRPQHRPCRSGHTKCRGNTRWSRPPRRTAGSTATGRSTKHSSRSAERERMPCSPTGPVEVAERWARR